MRADHADTDETVVKGRLYACFTRARCALDLCDALATYPGARSFVGLSQAPCFRRRWPSVYAALADGRIDRGALRALFRDKAPRPAAGARQVLALDSSPIRGAWDRDRGSIPRRLATARPGLALHGRRHGPARCRSHAHMARDDPR